MPGEPGLPHQPGPLTPGGPGRRRQQGERSEEVRVHPGADVSSSPRLTAGEHCLTVILMSQYRQRWEQLKDMNRIIKAKATTETFE